MKTKKLRHIHRHRVVRDQAGQGNSGNFLQQIAISPREASRTTRTGMLQAAALMVSALSFSCSRVALDSVALRHAPAVGCANEAPLPADVLKIYEARFRPLHETKIALPPASNRRGSTSTPAVLEADVNALWNALVDACSDNRELALQAARQNPTVLSPLYTSPVKVAESKAALVEVLGSDEEAVEIVLKNPAVLQCGKGLLQQQPSEIKGFAAIRSFADRVPPTVSQGILGLVCATLVLNIALSKSDDEVRARFARCGDLMASSRACCLLASSHRAWLLSSRCSSPPWAASSRLAFSGRRPWSPRERPPRHGRSGRDMHSRHARRPRMFVCRWPASGDGDGGFQVVWMCARVGLCTCRR